MNCQTIRVTCRNRRNDAAPLYAGTSKDMDHIASEIVLDAYRGNWNDVNRGLERLQRLEKRRNLVKLSKLLMFRYDITDWSRTSFSPTRKE